MPPEALLADFPHLAVTAERLRTIVRSAVPEAIERVRPGWRLIGYDLPVGRRTVFFAWIWPQPEHVHLGFVHGVAVPDPDRLLRGQRGVKLARWTTFTAGESIDDGALAQLVLAAAEIAVLPPAARRSLALERGSEDRT